MKIVSTVERAVSHNREFGKFLVIYKSGVKVFNSLVTAFQFYYNLETEASLWDITDQEELLEKKCIRM